MMRSSAPLVSELKGKREDGVFSAIESSAQAGANPLTSEGVLPKTSGVVVRKTVILHWKWPRKGGCDAKLP
jgi:hypothetical protein